jgi:DNA gyrase/topoisomerase IV subunit B
MAVAKPTCSGSGCCIPHNSRSREEEDAVSAEPPPDDTSMIEVLSGREAVPQRPTMYLDSLDNHATYGLIWQAIDGLLWHYRCLGHMPNRLEVGLEDDASATVVSYVQESTAAHRQANVQLLQRELKVLRVGASAGLFIVNALSARLTAAARTVDDLWHSFTFEEGIFRYEESPTCFAGTGSDIRLAVWPDFTILEPGPFEYAHALEQVRSFADSDPLVSINVINAHRSAG